MKYECFQDLFSSIWQIKDFVLQLKKKDLKDYKLAFYKQDFPQWRLDLLWEFIWGDMDYPTIYFIFKNAKVITRR